MVRNIQKMDEAKLFIKIPSLMGIIILVTVAAGGTAAILYAKNSLISLEASLTGGIKKAGQEVVLVTAEADETIETDELVAEADQEPEISSSEIVEESTDQEKPPTAVDPEISLAGEEETESAEKPALDQEPATSTEPVAQGDSTPETAEPQTPPAKPHFSTNPGTPSGTLIRSTKTLVALFNITAIGGNINFEYGLKNTLTIGLGSSIKEGDNDKEDITLVDELDYRILDIVEHDISESYENAVAVIDFDFSNNNLTVYTDQIKTIGVYVDTYEMRNIGDAIQVCLYGNRSINGVLTNWAINGEGNYTYNPGDDQALVCAQPLSIYSY